MYSLHTADDTKIHIHQKTLSQRREHVERCTKCILPRDLPDVNFNKDGICQYCQNTHKKKRSQSDSVTLYNRERLEKIFHRAKGKGRYDCLVPLSGGKDSTFVLYLTAKIYGLRVLAYNFDNGFRSKQAIENIERAVDKSGADLLVYRLQQNTMNQIFSIFLKNAGEFCSPCNLMMWDFAREIAAQKKIKLILSGNSEHMAASIDVMSHSAYCDRNYFLNVTQDTLLRKEAENLCGPPYVVRGIRQLLNTWPVQIDTFDYYDVSVQEIEDTITSKLGWKKPGPEIEHGDCRLACLKDHIMVHNYGCSEITGHYCSLIRNGEMERKDALEKANAEEPFSPPAVLDELLDKTHLSHHDFYHSIKQDFKKIGNIRSNIGFKAAKKGIDWWLKIQGKK